MVKQSTIEAAASIQDQIEAALDQVRLSPDCTEMRTALAADEKGEASWDWQPMGNSLADAVDDIANRQIAERIETSFARHEAGPAGISEILAGTDTASYDALCLRAYIATLIFSGAIFVAVAFFAGPMVAAGAALLPPVLHLITAFVFQQKTCADAHDAEKVNALFSDIELALTDAEQATKRFIAQVDVAGAIRPFDRAIKVGRAWGAWTVQQRLVSAVDRRLARLMELTAQSPKTERGWIISLMAAAPVALGVIVTALSGGQWLAATVVSIGAASLAAITAFKFMNDRQTARHNVLLRFDALFFDENDHQGRRAPKGRTRSIFDRRLAQVDPIATAMQNIAALGDAASQTVDADPSEQIDAARTNKTTGFSGHDVHRLRLSTAPSTRDDTSEGRMPRRPIWRP